MGTRGFIGFVVDGKERIAYNHFDSYPEGLGVAMLTFAGHCRSNVPPSLLERFGRTGLPDGITWRDLAGVLEPVEEGDIAPESETKRLWHLTGSSVTYGKTGQREEWYNLLRNAQGDPQAILLAGVYGDASYFPSDSLFAEWGYIIDYDQDRFEAYQGFQKAPHELGRFADREPYKPEHRKAVEYWPVALLASWPLGDLPGAEEFTEELNRLAEEMYERRQPQT